MLILDSGVLTYKLRTVEILGAFGKSPKANFSNLTSVTLEKNPWTTKVLRGIRAPGAGFPYLIMLGTMRHRRGKDFCVVYRKNPVLVLEFENEKYKRWVIPATNENKDILSNLISK
jgi:hypothetical protein